MVSFNFFSCYKVGMGSSPVVLPKYDTVLAGEGKTGLYRFLLVGWRGGGGLAQTGSYWLAEVIYLLYQSKSK